jgi:hypothetical protein
MEKKEKMTRDSGKDGPLEWAPRFGSIAVEMGHATSEQIKCAICEQVDDDIQNKPRRPLGRILFERDSMSHKEVEIVMNAVFKRKNTPNSPGSF